MQLFDTMYHISTISDKLNQGVDSGSVVSALDFQPQPFGFESQQGPAIFQTMHHFLRYNDCGGALDKILDKLLTITWYCLHTNR